MKNFLRNPVVLSSIGAFILILLGLLMPGRVGIALSAYAPTNTPVPAPTSTSQPGPASPDEISERARGITRPGIDTSGGGSNTAKAQVTLCSDPVKGCSAGSFDIFVPFEPPLGRFVKLASFNTSDSLPKTSTFTDATNPANGWSVVESASSKGSNWRNIQIFNAAGTLVANFDIKVS